MKLVDLFHFEPRKSAIDIPCEIQAGHLSKKYVHLKFEKVVMTEIKEGNSTISVPVSAGVEINVCQNCYNQFVYDATVVARDIDQQ